MPITLKGDPLAEALKKFSGKTPVGSILRSRDWEAVRLALRERALFSSAIESANVLGAMQRRILQALKMARDGKNAYMDRSRFIRELREIAAAEGLGSRGTGSPSDLRDITSRARLGLIWDMQTRSVQGAARRKTGLAAGAIDAVPAWEFRRVAGRKVPRADWPERWMTAAAASGDSEAARIYGETRRMVALKTSGIWEALSRFGTPWEPFDYGSGMGLRGVRRADAEALGLVNPGELVKAPAEDPFERSLEASTANLKPEYVAALKRVFGDQLETGDGVLRWKGTA